MVHYCQECADFPGRGEFCKVEKKILEISANKACPSFRSNKNLEVIKPNQPLYPETKYIEFLKTDEQGNQTVIDRTDKTSNVGIAKVLEVIELRKIDGNKCPYSYRYV